jgi:hypothetical protein
LVQIELRQWPGRCGAVQPLCFPVRMVRQGLRAVRRLKPAVTSDCNADLREVLLSVDLPRETGETEMRKLLFALVVAMGAFAFAGGTPASAAGAAGAVTGMSDLVTPGAGVDKVRWVRRCYWRYHRRVCRTVWRPGWRHHRRWHRRWHRRHRRY